MSSHFDNMSRRNFGRLSIPLVVTAVDGWPSFLFARETQDSGSSSAAPQPKEGKGNKGQVNGERHTAAESSSAKSLAAMHYPYNAIETEPANRRQQALGMEPSSKKSERSAIDTALGKSDGRPEIGFIVPHDMSLPKNIANVEKAETAVDLVKISSDIIDAFNAKDTEPAVAKLQKDTVEFLLNALVETAVQAHGKGVFERLPTKIAPLTEYGAKKGVTDIFAPEVEMINDGVTAVRHAVTKGDFTEMREISDHARRVTLDLAIHLYIQNSYLHPRSPNH